MNSKLTVLDCTLRDGGYYNDWAFSNSFVKKYIGVMVDSPVSVLEIGYRNPQDCSALEYEDYLRTVVAGASLHTTQLAVMLNAKKFHVQKDRMTMLVEHLFLPASQSAISMIRIAVNFEQVHNVRALVSLLSEKGYRIALNLMQIGSATVTELSRTIECLQHMKGVDVVYIADSLGAMSANKVTCLLHMLKESAAISTGFHAHDNKGLALLNSQAAIAAGATYVDATLMGMGRGAGNTKTEQLLPLLGTFPEQMQPIQQFLIAEMSPLYFQYMWGNDALYQYAADNAMHPMYVQDIKSRVNRDLCAGFELIRLLAKKDCRQYHKSFVDEAFNQPQLRAS